MSQAIQVYADLGLDGNLIFNHDNLDFPPNPSVGTFTVVNSILYGFMKIGSMTTWFPFSSVRKSYIHTQTVPSLIWTVNHNLATGNLWYQVQDQDGNILIPGKHDLDINSFQLYFTTEKIGTCLVVGPDVIDVPEVLATLLNIGSGAVVIDSSGIRINGEYVVTNGIITNQIDAAIGALPNPSVNLGSYTSLTSLTTTHPANTNAGNIALIGNAAPYVLCRSDGAKYIGSGEFSTLGQLETLVTAGIPAGSYKVGPVIVEYDGINLLLDNIVSPPIYGGDGRVQSVTVDGITSTFTYGINTVTVDNGITKTIITTDANGNLQSVNTIAV